MTPATIALPLADLIPNHTLDRLYKRRKAVENLARSAEAPRAGLHTMPPRLLGPHPDIL
jgi:hypothetical protein